MSEQKITDTLRRMAEAPGAPDEQAAWQQIRWGIERDRGRRRLRTVLTVSGVALAAAAAVAVVVIAAGDDREAVDVGPAGTTTTAPASSGALPEHPLAVVVEVDGGQRLDLYDADTGALVTAGLAESVHSISEVSVADDGWLFYTEEFGDSSTIRTVYWDGASPPLTPYELDGNETSSPALSADGNRFAFVHQGVTVPRPTIVVLDTQTGEQWSAEAEASIQSIRDLAFSPSGNQLTFTSAGELWVMDTTAEGPVNGRRLDHGSDDFVLEGHASADFEVIVLTACCGADLDLELRAFAAVTLDGPSPVELPPADDVRAFDVNGEQTMALVTDAGAVTLAPQLGRGAERPLAIDGAVRDVGW